jgi:hypothetical protein
MKTNKSGRENSDVILQLVDQQEGIVPTIRDRNNNSPDRHGWALDTSSINSSCEFLPRIRRDSATIIDDTTNDNNDAGVAKHDQASEADEEQTNAVRCHETLDSPPASMRTRARKYVHFSTVEIREYACCIGDHPHVETYPLALDWAYAPQPSRSVDDHEHWRACCGGGCNNHQHHRSCRTQRLPVGHYSNNQPQQGRCERRTRATDRAARVGGGGAGGGVRAARLSVQERLARLLDVTDMECATLLAMERQRQLQEERHRAAIGSPPVLI